MGINLRCLYCQKIVIEDLKEYSKEKEERYIQCPYCGGMMKNKYYDYFKEELAGEQEENGN